MARFDDYSTDSEVKDIMERLYAKFPLVFAGLKVNEIHFIKTKGKKSRFPIKIRRIGYPLEVFAGKPYLVEVFNDLWVEMNEKKKNLAVFKMICAIPEGAFDPLSKSYGKLVKPDYDMYRLEFAASGGVPDWMENGTARDPMDIDPAKVELTGKSPVTSI